MEGSKRAALLDPLIHSNPITVQVLGICSALAVTTRMDTALVMSVAVIAVLTLSNVLISALRQHIVPAWDGPSPSSPWPGSASVCDIAMLPPACEAWGWPSS